jgi:hypothetical protein
LVGVVPALPPKFFWVSPLSVQLAVQLMLAVWLEPCVMVTLYKTVAGLLIVLITVQLAFACGVPVALQKPAVLALAVVTPATSAPTASNPVKVAQNTARPDLSIINCLSALARSPQPPCSDAMTSAQVYTRFTNSAHRTAICTRLDKSGRRKAL